MAKVKSYFYHGILKTSLVKHRGDGDVRAIFDVEEFWFFSVVGFCCFFEQWFKFLGDGRPVLSYRFSCKDVKQSFGGSMGMYLGRQLCFA